MDVNRARILMTNKLYCVIISVITMGAFLFNTIIIDPALATDNMQANEANTSQLRPHATGAKPGIAGQILNLFRGDKDEDQPANREISALFARLQEVKDLGDYRKPSPEKTAVAKDLRNALSKNRSFKPNRTQLNILLSALKFEALYDNHKEAATLAECVDNCIINSPDAIKIADIYKLIDAIYNFDQSGPGVDAVRLVLGQAAANNLGFVYKIIHKRRKVLTTLDSRDYFSDFEELARALGMYAVKSGDPEPIINRLLEKMGKVKTAALAQFLEHLFAKCDKLFKIPGILISVLDAIEKVKDEKMDSDRGNYPATYLSSIFFHSLEKYPDSVGAIVSILKAKGDPELTKMLYWVILNYLCTDPRKHWSKVKEIFPDWLNKYKRFLIKYMHLLYYRSSGGILSRMAASPTLPYYFEFLYSAEDEEDLKDRIRVCEYFFDVEMYAKGKITVTAETFDDLIRWYNFSMVFDYGVALEFLSFSPEERENYFRNHDNELRKIRGGGFDKTDPLHILLGYELLIQEIRNHPAIKKDISYEDYKVYLEKPKEDIAVFSRKEQAEISYLCYEAIRLKNFIRRLKNRADELERPLVVVENLTYGWLATFAIEEKLEAMGVKIIRTKAGSTYAHGNPTVMHGLGELDDANLFDKDDLQYLVENEPIVVVVDGTYSLDSQRMQQFRRKTARFPDAQQAYRNFFYALSGEPRDEDFAMQGLKTTRGALVSDELRKSMIYNMVREKVDNIKPASQRPNYGMFFWYPGKKSLEVDSERKGRLVPERLTLNNPSNAKQPFIDRIKGPAVIFAVANMEDHMIDKRVRVKRVYHNSAYFDDKAPFGRVFVDITPYGPKVSEAFSIAVINEYQRLKKVLGAEEPVVEIAKPPKFVSIQALIADFDDTLVLFSHWITQAPATKQYLETLLSLGIPIAIITEEREKNVEERFWSHIAPHLRKNLHIFSNGGTHGFGFDKKGEKVPYFTYEVNPEVREHILDVVKRTLPAGSYSIEPRDYKVKLRIKDRKKRREYADLLNRAFLKEGINVTISYQGGHHINLFIWSKVSAARYFEEHILQPAGISLEDSLVLADQVRSYGADRRLFEALDTSWRVNVGSASPTLRDDRIFHLHRQGPPASGDILANISRHGGNLDISQIPYTPPTFSQGESAFEMVGEGETVKHSSAGNVPLQQELMVHDTHATKPARTVSEKLKLEHNGNRAVSNAA